MPATVTGGPYFDLIGTVAWKCSPTGTRFTRFSARTHTGDVVYIDLLPGEYTTGNTP